MKHVVGTGVLAGNFEFNNGAQGARRGQLSEKFGCQLRHRRAQVWRAKNVGRIFPILKGLPVNKWHRGLRSSVRISTEGLKTFERIVLSGKFSDILQTTTRSNDYATVQSINLSSAMS